MKKKIPTLQEGVEWIAENDDEGGSDALVASVVAGYLSTCLVADLFGVSPRTVARKVVEYRRARS